MTLEIVVFILSVLLGIFWYWSEAGSNSIYRLVNRITHSKELQMKPDNKKGFIHGQPFLIRLVWIALFFVLSGVLINLLTPINAFYLQYFASAIVGTFIGSYIASAYLFAREKAKLENLDKAMEKGEKFINDLTNGPDSTTVDSVEPEPEPQVAPEKSARERLKNKGMIK